jgi:hypothetical protein
LNLFGAEYVRQIIIFMGLLLASVAISAAPSSVAFFYADQPPVAELAQFDWVVLEPGHATPEALKTLYDEGSRAFAYLSVGEMITDQTNSSLIDPGWKLGSNQAWSSSVMDLANPGWQDYLLQRARDMQSQGFQGLFLDTLDSYQLLPPAARAAQQQGLRQILERLHRELPGLALFFNRGFEVIEGLSWTPDAVAVESLYAGWDQAGQTYRAVPKADQDWLQVQFAPLKKRGIPIVILDYLPPEQRDAARALAKRLTAEGFIPWVSVPALDYLGVGAVEVLPRRIAVLYDPREGDLSVSSGHLLYGGLLEYLGYRVDYFAVDQALPEAPTRGLYAGVLLWMTSGPPTNAAQFERWLLAQKAQGVPLAFIAGLPITQERTLTALGLELKNRKITVPLQLQLKDTSLFGFEAPVTLRTRNLTPLRIKAEQVTPLLQLSGAKGQLWTVAGLADWGGFALAPYVLENGAEGQRRWILDPLSFIQKALRLPPIPVPDATTENGRRIATVHLDGDGFVSRAEVAGTPYAGRLILEQFLKPYPLLSSVSVIEGEIGPKGMFPYLSPELEPIAREIFAEGQVEVANHTFSHPFYWQPQRAAKREGFTAEYGLHLNIPGYILDYQREVLGTQAYINTRLTTPQKPVKVMFWSGDALPDEATLRLAYQGGMDNINGGATKLTAAFPSLTGLYPMVRPLNGALQFYAPITNENVYTNLWTGPHYGFRDVLETFKLTDKPRRLRPLSLYYHFYAGTKLAGIESLHAIYRSILAQQPLPLWISEFLQRQKGAYYASIALRADGGYQIRALQGLRTVRLPKELGWPDLARSHNVAGVRDLPQGRYVHLSGSQATLYLRPDADPGPSLLQANLPLIGWVQEGPGQVRLSFKGQFPLTFSVQASGNCRLQLAGQSLTATRVGKAQQFSLSQNQVSDALLQCR